MFGYLVPLREEMKVGEYELYRAAYCGLCRACPGNGARAVLSYDTVVLALFRLLLAGKEPEAVSFRCAAHPLRGRRAVKEEEELRLCAGIGCLLAAYKLRDDGEDEGGVYRLSPPFARLLRRSAALPALEEALEEPLSRLAQLEKSPAPIADALALCAGELLGEAFAFGLSGKDADLARAFGSALGAWIYLADAADDLGDDRKKGRFNPFLSSPPPSAALRTSLLLHCRDAEEALSAVPGGSGAIRAILANILSLGLPARAEEILAKYRKSTEEPI